jgi:HupE / UreJ protein
MLPAVPSHPEGEILMARRSAAWIPLTTALLVALMIPSRPGRAHEFKLESVMTGFVKIEPREAHLVVRVPFHVLRGIKFPLSGAQIALDRADPAIQQALDLVGRQLALFEEGRRLPPTTAIGRLSLPSDRSFDRYETAARHVSIRPDTGTGIYADQGYVDAHFTYAIASPASRFAVRTAVALDLKDYLKLAIRYLPLGEEGRAMVITSRSGTVPLNPAWYQAASGFVALGIAHILNGIDHLLFLLCLVIPLIGLRQVLAVVTAFTVAHSFTLLGAAYGLAPEGAWFPPFVETAIAASIVYMALEDIVGADLRRRWLITGLFGLIHGFGFSYGLRENLQFAGRHLVVSLLSFNVGIELGQIAVLVVLLPALAFIRRHVHQERIAVILLSALVAHTGWHWLLERGEVLWKVEWPELNAEALAVLARWIAGILLAAGIVAFLSRRAGSILSRMRGVPDEARRPPKVEA